MSVADLYKRYGGKKPIEQYTDTGTGTPYVVKETEVPLSKDTYLGVLNQKRNAINQPSAFETEQDRQFINERNAKIQKALAGYERMMKYLPTLQKDQGRAGLGISESGYIEAAANRNNLLANAMRDYDAQVLAYNKALEDERKQQLAELDQRELDLYRTVDAEERAEQRQVRADERAYDIWKRKNNSLVDQPGYEFTDDAEGSEAQGNTGGMFSYDENGNYTIKGENGNYVALFDEKGNLSQTAFSYFSKIGSYYNSSGIKAVSEKWSNGEKMDSELWISTPYTKDFSVKIASKPINDAIVTAVADKAGQDVPFAIGNNVYIKASSGYIFRIVPNQSDESASRYFNYVFFDIEDTEE